MNESSQRVTADEDPVMEDQPVTDDEPQFGLLDVVEAFTAMRHEWRGQTKESRQLAEQIEAAVNAFQGVESKLLDRLPSPATTDDDARRMAQVIADLDHQFTRAVDAVEQAETHRRQCEREEARSIEQCVAKMSGLARWFARPLIQLLTDRTTTVESRKDESPAVEGLRLVLSRIRRSMKELHIERVDTQGQPFDAEMMNAIGTVDSPEYPAGHVAEQLAPGYRWKGQVLSFADVRVAK